MNGLKLSIVILCILLVMQMTGCSDNEVTESSCVQNADVLSSFTTREGERIKIYDNGAAFSISEDNNCDFLVQYFDPDLLNNRYQKMGDEILLIDGNISTPTLQNFQENMESTIDQFELVRQDIAQTNRYFTNFTLQSPMAPQVSDYVQLQRCLLSGTCNFLDNRFDIVDDPVQSNNQVVSFYSVAPSENMVTAKSSIVSTLLYFEKGDSFWFAAKFYLDGDYPTTITDFESSLFEGSPGPRLIFSNGHLGIENKFGSKQTFLQNEGEELDFPIRRWVEIKLRIDFDEEDGQFKLWQDDQLIIEQRAATIPLSLWVLDRLEVGISATNVETFLLVDDIQISNDSL